MRGIGRGVGEVGKEEGVGGEEGDLDNCNEEQLMTSHRSM